jgi:hypothetical protein
MTPLSRSSQSCFSLRSGIRSARWANAPRAKVTDFSGNDLYIENPRISRDGTKLFYARGRRTGDIFILHFGSGAKKKPR